MLNVDSVGTELLDGTGAVAVQQLPEITASECSEAKIRDAILRQCKEWKKPWIGFCAAQMNAR